MAWILIFKGVRGRTRKQWIQLEFYAKAYQSYPHTFIVLLYTLDAFYTQADATVFCLIQIITQNNREAILHLSVHTAKLRLETFCLISKYVLIPYLKNSGIVSLTGQDRLLITVTHLLYPLSPDGIIAVIGCLCLTEGKWEVAWPRASQSRWSKVGRWHTGP